VEREIKDLEDNLEKWVNMVLQENQGGVGRMVRMVNLGEMANQELMVNQELMGKTVKMVSIFKFIFLIQFFFLLKI
jgi:hypothetical protein